MSGGRRAGWDKMSTDGNNTCLDITFAYPENSGNSASP